VTQQVGVEFNGSARGAVGAAQATSAAIAGVRREANTLSPSLRAAETDVGRLSRGALAGSGVLAGFGRSVAFASTAFIGGAGLIALLRDSVDAAETSTKAHDSLDTSITRLGGDFKVARPELDAWAASQARFGVSVNDALQGLARLVPLTGSVRKAMQAYSLALELSKGDNIDLSAAETAVAKALDGKTTSLQRYGIVLQKNASNEQVAAAISARFGGQARANTTDLDRLHATIGNLELKLGQALLPEIDKVAGGLDGWLSNEKNVNRVVGDTRTVVGDTAAVVKTFAKGANTVAGALGGWKQTLEILLALKVASKVYAWANALSKAATEATILRKALIALGGAEVLGPLAAVAAALGAIYAGIKLSGGSRDVTIHTANGPVTVTVNGLRGGLVTPSGQRVGVGGTGSSHVNPPSDQPPRGTGARATAHGAIPGRNIVGTAQWAASAAGRRHLVPVRRHPRNRQRHPHRLLRVHPGRLQAQRDLDPAHLAGAVFGRARAPDQERAAAGRPRLLRLRRPPPTSASTSAAG
jgi:hypothetical protein